MMPCAGLALTRGFQRGWPPGPQRWPRSGAERIGAALEHLTCRGRLRPPIRLVGFCGRANKRFSIWFHAQNVAVGRYSSGIKIPAVETLAA